MGDYLKDIMAKKRQFNEKRQAGWSAEERSTPNTAPKPTNTKDPKKKSTLEELSSYQSRRDQLEDKRIDRKEHRTEVNKWLSDHEQQKHDDKEQEFKSEITLRDQYEQRWKAQEYLYEKTKREKAKARQERSQELGLRSTEFLENNAAKGKEEVESNTRVEQWSNVYHARTTQDARNLGKAIARIQFQQVLENKDEDADDDNDDDFARVQLRRRRHGQKQTVRPRDIDDSETHQLTNWYHSKSLARHGNVLAPSSASSTGGTDRSVPARDYSSYLKNDDSAEDSAEEEANKQETETQS